MESTQKSGKEKQHGPYLRTLHKVLIFFLVLIICGGFFLGLELFRRRLSALEDTVDKLNEVCRREKQASHANQRSRRETSSLTLEDVRNEIRSQLRSVTATKLCSPQEKVCLAGPPGERGEPGLRGKRGKKGKTGDTGDPGNTGPPGNPGIQGIKGERGDPGRTGDDGVKGEKGDPGTGYPGIQGIKGERGEPGRTGDDGVKGEKGDPGPEGHTAKGSTGGFTGRAPSIFVSPSTSLNVVENSFATFRCYATGRPTPTTVWEKIGSGESYGDPSGKLAFAKVQSKDSGKYICRAFNMHGMKEVTVELNVKGKPVIQELLRNPNPTMTVDAYKDVTIFCHASGHPTPEVRFMKADYTDLPEGRTEVRNNSLTIKKIRAKESAVYTCKALNSFGAVEMRVNVTVRPRSGRGRKDAARSCKELKTEVPSVTSGQYWLDPDLGSFDNAFLGYCDQETDGGGWTLVWSYRFVTKDNYLWRKSKFFSPRPSFPTRPNEGRYSYLPPLNPTIPSDPSLPAAMNFSLWKTLGTEMLLRSDQMNWYICKDGIDRDDDSRTKAGSILKWKTGSISCRVAKTLVENCTQAAPILFESDLYYGMRLYKRHHVYSYKQSEFYRVTVMAWGPSSARWLLDSCPDIPGENIKEDVKDPRGAWFVR